MEFGLLLSRFCLSQCHFHEPWIIFSLHFVVKLSLASTILIRCLVGREDSEEAMGSDVLSRSQADSGGHGQHHPPPRESIQL